MGQDDVPDIGPADLAQRHDTSAIATCVEAQSQPVSSCIGLIAQPCIDDALDDNITLVTMDCNAREAAAWNNLMAMRFQELLREAEERDRAPGPYAERNSADTLRVSQQSWIAYRDAELARFWAMRAPAPSYWKSADLERLRIRLTVSRFADLVAVQ